MFRIGCKYIYKYILGSVSCKVQTKKPDFIVRDQSGMDVVFTVAESLFLYHSIYQNGLYYLPSALI